MPMHDWTRVEAGVYHMFHGAWLYAISHRLNDGLLPNGLYAMPEQRAGIYETDVLTLQAPVAKLPPAPDLSSEYSPIRNSPSTSVLERERAAPEKRRGRRVVIRHISNHNVVAVIELVSPGNKSSRTEYDTFVSKAATLLNAGVHLLVIDPFAPPRRASNGLHASIWRRAARRRKDRPPFMPTADRPLLAVSYCASRRRLTAAIEAFAVGAQVPSMPLFLTAEEDHIVLPLEATYDAAFREVPKVWREELEAVQLRPNS